MKFLKYQHVERLGTVETDNILMGMCYIFPKIDGTNASVWLDDGQIKAGSRNRELSLEKDNAGFLEWVITQSNLIQCLLDNPELRIYGEWLVPHTLKTYTEEAWRNFYIFDVMKNDKYLSYEEYKEIIDKYNLEYIPPICKVKNPTYERLIAQLDKNGYLIKDGEGSGEGIVIKRYDYINKFQRVTWAKIVKNEFKVKHSRDNEVTEINEIEIVETKIIDKYVTPFFIEKEYAKLAIDGWQSKMIPRLLNTIYYNLITEESWNFIKEFKNPKIDYKILLRFCTAKIKEIKADLF